MNALRIIAAALAVALFGIGAAQADAGKGSPVTTSAEVMVHSPY